MALNGLRRYEVEQQLTKLGWDLAVVVKDWADREDGRWEAVSSVLESFTPAARAATVTFPEAQSDAAGQERCLKAVAQLAGVDLDDATGTWQKVKAARTRRGWE